MPDSSGLVVHPENNISRPNFGQVLQPPGGIGCVPEDQRADHGGVTAAAVIFADEIFVHDLPGCGRGRFIFVRIGGVMGSPDGPRRPVLFQLPQKGQNIFLSNWHPVCQVAVPGTTGVRTGTAVCRRCSCHDHSAIKHNGQIPAGDFGPANGLTRGQPLVKSGLTGGVVIPCQVRQVQIPQDHGAGSRGCNRVIRAQKAPAIADHEAVVSAVTGIWSGPFWDIREAALCRKVLAII